MVAVGIAAAGLQWAMGSELLFDVWQPQRAGAAVLRLPRRHQRPRERRPGDGAVGGGARQPGRADAHEPRGAGRGAERRGRRTVRVELSPAARCRPLAPSGCCGPRRVAAGGCGSNRSIEQFTGPGQGNLSPDREAQRRQDTATVRLGSTATRMVAEVVALSPWFASGQLRRRRSRRPGPTTAITGIVSPAGGGSGRDRVAGGNGRRHRGGALRSERRGLAAMTDHRRGSHVVTAVVGLATSPVSLFGASLHQMRWLWPIAGLLTAAGVAVLLSLLHGRPRVHRPMVIAAVGVAVLVAAANLPTHVGRRRVRSTGSTSSRPAASSWRQLGALEGRGPVLYDPSTLYFGEPYSGMTFAELAGPGHLVRLRRRGARSGSSGRAARRRHGDACACGRSRARPPRDVPPGRRAGCLRRGAGEGPSRCSSEPIG